VGISIKKGLMKKLIEKLLPELVKTWQQEAIDSLLTDVWKEQTQGHKKTFIRVYDDIYGKTWEVKIKLKD